LGSVQVYTYVASVARSCCLSSMMGCRDIFNTPEKAEINNRFFKVKVSEQVYVPFLIQKVG
jgi:hypothetical protein